MLDPRRKRLSVSLNRMAVLFGRLFLAGVPSEIREVVGSLSDFFRVLQLQLGFAHRLARLVQFGAELNRLAGCGSPWQERSTPQDHA